MVKFLKKLIKSHQNAFRGILNVYATETSFRIQLWFGIIVLTQAFYWPIGEIKRLILLLLILLVLLAEILNTTFEKLFDVIEKRYNNHIGYLKDILAGGVLIMATGSVIIGTLILSPYIIKVMLSATIEAALIVIFIHLFRLIKALIKK